MACQPPKSEGDRPSSFDRLAEDASYLNKRGEAEQVIALLEPHQGDEGNDSALFFHELGVALRREGRLPEAIRSYGKALSLDPGNPVTRKNLADAYFLSGDYARAVEQCREVLRSNPLFHQAHSTLALSLYRLDRYEESLAEFETVLELNPGDGQALGFRRVLRAKLRQTGKH